MSKIEFSESFVRGLKGAPSLVLIVLSMQKQPVTAQYLQDMTGYTDKPVESALRYLERVGLVTRNGRYSWRIANNAQQLPLMNSLPENEELNPEVDDCQAEEPEKVENCEEIPDHDTELFRLPSSSRSLNLDLTNQEDLLLANDTEKFRVDKNRAECDHFGIREPKKSLISQMPDVTPVVIRYHCSSLPEKDRALAIYRIQHHFQVPKEWIQVENSKRIVRESIEEIPPESDDVCAQTWDSFLESVRPDFKSGEFETWIKSSRLVEISETGWKVKTGNKVAAKWIQEHALTLLESRAGLKIKLFW